VVRHQVLVLAFGGSNPSSPATCSTKQLEKVMPERELVLPEPSKLETIRNFIDPALIAETNAAVRAKDNLGEFVLHHASSSEVEEIINPEKGCPLLPFSLAKMAGIVIDYLPFKWSRLSLYIRHMHTSQQRSLNIHPDNTYDIRLLIEGDRARWIFDQPKYLRQYPEGLALRAGDAVILNNQCPKEMQVRHGVRLGDDVNVRTSYLFNFQA
jgi:hypothetical protein